MFLEEVKKGIECQMENGVKVNLNHMKKNNGVELDGIIIMKEDKAMALNVSLNLYYERWMAGMEIEKIVEEIVSLQKESKEEVFFELYGEFNKLKSSIIFRIVNYNKNESLLKELPHIHFLDLAIIFYYLVKKKEDGVATVQITEKISRSWNLSNKELFHIARKNTERLFPVQLRTMGEVLRELFKEEGKEENLQEELSEPHIPMFILSNSMGVHGASVLLYHGVIQNLSACWESDIFILPSSVHEVILVPCRFNMEQERLERMVREVNNTYVSEEDILSDQVYLYKRDKNEIEF